MEKYKVVKNLEVPEGKIDVVLDTDAFNEVDDQYAISYLLASEDKLNIKGFVAAPFHNGRSSSPGDGMEKSYDEIKHILKLAGREEFSDKVYRGSDRFLENEETPVESEGADFMIELSKKYSSDNPLYIVAIGAITNVASALIKDEEMRERVVVVWLGGKAHQFDAYEFNMIQDIAAARIIFSCGVPFVQLPCMGVVDHFQTSRYELEHWLIGKNPLCDYLAGITIRDTEDYAPGTPWSRVIWDVTAVAWLLNDGDRFMDSQVVPAPIPEYDGRYAVNTEGPLMRYVTYIKRDELMNDLFKKLASYR